MRVQIVETHAVTLQVHTCLLARSMLHRSGTNDTGTDRRALFGIYNAERDGNFHDRYYQREAKGRRAAGTKGLQGKANVFFTGTGVVAEAKM